MMNPHIPTNAVLLIPEPDVGQKPLYGITPGYYNRAQMLSLLSVHARNSEALHFIADMLESGVAEYDGFAATLRANSNNPASIEQMIQACR